MSPTFGAFAGTSTLRLTRQSFLIHGENGAGKTSLLSAMEYGLTGNVQALDRADPEYAEHLLHRSATQGKIIVKTDVDDEEKRFHAVLDETGAHPYLGSIRRNRRSSPNELTSRNRY